MLCIPHEGVMSSKSFYREKYWKLRTFNIKQYKQVYWWHIQIKTLWLNIKQFWRMNNAVKIRLEWLWLQYQAFFIAELNAKVVASNFTT